MGKFEDATKEGYVFKGWWDSASGGSEISSIDEKEKSDVTLYARWAVTYKVTFLDQYGYAIPGYNKKLVEYGSGDKAPSGFHPISDVGYVVPANWEDGGNGVTVAAGGDIDKLTEEPNKEFIFESSGYTIS